ncbi:MAG: glutamate--cysteine ligase, partial [Gammaproteobacteria bacterium]|nr:glutamate--cysteine ligase [Gammaproteobacteria bacterium]
GFDNDNIPHVRVEHRVVSAGPTIMDEIANTAFYYGALEWMVMNEKEYEKEIEHAKAKLNFYEGARFGLNALIDWTGDRKMKIDKLILEELLPGAKEGLRSLGINEPDIKQYLGIIEARTRTQRTGASWQKSFINNCESDMHAMLEAYYNNQQSNLPVHDWKTS